MTAPASNTNTTPTSIHPGTQVGLLALTVSDLARSLAYYTEAVGFELLQRGEGEAVLGAAGQPLLVLTEQPGAREWPRGGRSYTGLYHFAILLPTRADLGRWLRHWLELGLPFGQGDHLVSEAIYLEDPDMHGIEVYADRPREQWTWHNGQVQMATDPVDLRGLLAEAERSGQPWRGLPPGTRVGHVHLQVGSIPEATHFYHDILGFDIVAQMPSALFVSAGGYHHHLGLNTWHSLRAGPAPADSVRLRYFTVELPDADALNAALQRLDAAGVPHRRVGDVVAVEDPWQNTILLRVGTTPDAESAAGLAP